MSMTAGLVVVYNDGSEKFFPDDNTNAAKQLYNLLKSSQQNNTSPTVTVTPPALPSSGPLFTTSTTTLAQAANAGDTSIVVSRATFLIKGSSLQFADNGEKVIVASSYVVGSTTVPLTTALVGNHVINTTINFFTTNITPGSTTVNNGQNGNPPAPGVTIPSGAAGAQQKQAIANVANTYAQWMVTYLQSQAQTTSAYGELYAAAVGGGQTLTNANQYYQLTQFDTAGNSNGGTTISVPSNNITINSTGVYAVAVDMSITSSANNVLYTATIFKNGIQNSTVVSRTKVAAAGDLKFFALSDIADYNAGDVIDVRLQCDTANKVLTLEAGNFNVYSISSINGKVAGGII